MALSTRPTVLTRSSDGRWLDGVCAGLARGAPHPGWFRAAFVLAALLGGFGILAYLSCWLIIPREGEPSPGAGSGWRPWRLPARARSASAILVLAACGAVATLFGFGWIVMALAAIVLLVVVTAWPRLGPAWALLPIAALAMPSLAVAAGGLRLSPEISHYCRRRGPSPRARC